MVRLKIISVFACKVENKIQPKNGRIIFEAHQNQIWFEVLVLEMTVTSSQQSMRMVVGIAVHKNHCKIRATAEMPEMVVSMCPLAENLRPLKTYIHHRNDMLHKHNKEVRADSWRFCIMKQLENRHGIRILAYKYLKHKAFNFVLFSRVSGEI